MKKKYGFCSIILIMMILTSLFSFANDATYYDNQLRENKDKQKNISSQLNQVKKQEQDLITKIH